MFKKLICLSISAILAASVLSACSKNEGAVAPVNTKVLNITYNDSKYGSDWIRAITDKFKAVYPDVTVNLKADSNIDKTAGSVLEKAVSSTDLMFISNTNWQYWAKKGYLEEMSALFAEKNSDGKEIEATIKSDTLSSCKYNENYYVMPLNDSVPGFVYSRSLFTKNKWTVPKTMDELNKLLSDIKAKNITAFAWGAKDIDVWDGIVKTWWLQNEGKSAVREYLELKSPEVYKQDGRIKALTNFSELTVYPEYSFQDVVSTDYKKALGSFTSYKSAFLIGSSSAEATAKPNIAADFDMQLMKLPSMSDAKEAQDSLKVLENIALIPSHSVHKELAKKFLKFMCDDEMLKLFTEKTSSPRPFYYDALKTNNLSEFGKSVLKIWEDPDTVYMNSDNPLYYSVFSDWPASGAPYLRIYYGLTTPMDAVTENYNYVRDNWEKVKAGN